MTAQYYCPECKCPVHINRFDTKSTMCRTCKAKKDAERSAQAVKNGLAIDLVLGKSEAKP